MVGGVVLTGARLAGAPAEGATLLFDNPRVTVSDVAASASATERPRPNDFDTCRVALTAGSVRVAGIDGATTSVSQQIGDVVCEKKGGGRREVAGDRIPPPRTIVVGLKDVHVPALPNTSGYPNAFPRPGSRKVLETDRVLIWDYTWTPGSPTPMHFHDKDVVVVYLEEGELESTASDGQRVINPHFFGFTKFNPRDRTHTETLVKGKARAIIIELN
jgi:hypothetical protein